MLIQSGFIEVFPTVNSRDNGKLLLEENMHNIVTRITRMNYVYEVNGSAYIDNISLSTEIGSTTGSIATAKDILRFTDSFKCNINGYDINIPVRDGHSLEIIFKDYDTSSLHDQPNVIYLKSADYGTMNFGLVLSKMASQDRLKGDSIYTIDTGSNNTSQLSYYRGVELLCGEDFDSADNSIKLKLGSINLRKQPTGPDTYAIYINGYGVSPNRFIIDSRTIGILNENDNYLPLSNLMDEYVAKQGNTYHDTDSTSHKSDIYGSLMFRKSMYTNGINISLEQGNDSNEINIGNPLKSNAHTDDGFYNLKNGIKLQSYKFPKFGLYDRNAIFMNMFNIHDDIVKKYNTSGDVLGEINKLMLGSHADKEEDELSNIEQEIDIGGSEIKSIAIYSGDIYEFLQGNGRPALPHEFFHTPINKKFGTLFNKNNAEFIYNKYSLVGIECDENKSEISFGDKSTRAMLLSYDLNNADLSINDRLGSIGTLRFCDGQCVDNNADYISGKYTGSNNKLIDIPYDYSDAYVPKEESITISETVSNTCVRLNYVDTNGSKIRNIKRLGNSMQPDEYTVLTFDPIENQKLLTEVEARYGWYINASGGFFPGHGAFDTDSNGIKANYNSTVSSNYQYMKAYLDASNSVNTYDYYCKRYKIDKSAYGKYLLLNNLQEYISFLDENYDIASPCTNPSYINVYFCRTKRTGDSNANIIKFGFDNNYYPDLATYANNLKEYTRIGSIKTHDDITGFNDTDGHSAHFLRIPTSDNIRTDEELYVVISASVLSFQTPSYNKMYCVDTPQSSVYVSNNDSHYVKFYDIKSPTNNPEATFTNRGMHYVLSSGVHLGIVDSAKDSELLIDDWTNRTGNEKTTDKTFTMPDSNYLKCDIYYYNYDPNTTYYNCYPHYKFDYTTSKSYKSFRIHGYCKMASETKTGYNASSQNTPDTNYYNYRLIYNVGFELSPIVIERIEKVTNTELNRRYGGAARGVPKLYKLSREDGEDIIFTVKTTGFLPELNAGPYPHNYKYFYINDLNIINNISQNDNWKNFVFFGSNQDLTSADVNYTELDKDIIQSPCSSEWYKNNASSYPQSNNSVKQQISKNYLVSGTYYNRWWYIKDLNVINTTGINFNFGENKFNVNVDAFFNSNVHVNKLIFGNNDEELSVSISQDRARFVFYDENYPNDYKPIIIDKNGITLEDHTTGNSCTISQNIESDFNGLNISGDLRANRVFNAVYNDYADNVKCSNVKDYEPGDIICKDPKSDEYILSTKDLKRLVVGVYSDTYGHLLGGDKNKSIEENSNNYIPIAVAGNVRVKVTGFIQVGDLIEASAIPGVGQKAMSPELGTIIGKALESKDDDYYGVKRILMQVMLL